MSVRVRIYDTIWNFDDTVEISATSEDSNFPADNITNPLRAKMWRSGGYFVIGSTNKYIDFKDLIAGSEITATLTEGNYQREDLETQISYQLGLAGGQTYTTSYGTGTGKWTITSNGSEFQLLSNTGTNQANSVLTTLGFDTTTDYTGAVTYTGSTIALHTEEILIVDLKAGYSATPINSFALTFDKNRGNQFTESATITLVANDTKNFDSPAVSQSLTVDEDFDVALHFFTSNQSYRYWGVKIVDPENPNLAVELSTLLFSQATELSQNPDIGFSTTQEDQSKVDRNDYGYEYYDLYPQAKEYEFNFSVMTYSEMDTLWAMFDKLGNTEPMAIAIDIDEDLFDRDRMFLYGRFDGSIKPKHLIVDYFDYSLAVREAF